MTMITRSKRAPPAAMVAPSSRSKRRRCYAHTAAVDAQESPWVSALPADMVRLVGSRLLADGDGDGLLDYVRFRAFCGYWRSSTDSPNGRGVVDARFHPTRWVMLPEGHGLHPGHGKLRGFVRFFNLSTGAIVRVKLPLFRDHCILDSVDGLLLLQRDDDTTVRLLNPLTGDIADLPPLSTLLQDLSVLPMHQQYKSLKTLRDIGATAVRVSPDGAITVAFVLTAFPIVAFATAGDHRWYSAVSKYLFFTQRVLSFQGKIYMMLLCAPNNPPAGAAGKEQPVCKILEINIMAATATTTAAADVPAGSSHRKLAAKEKLLAAFPSGPWPLFMPFHMAAVGSEILLVGRCRRRLTLVRLADFILVRKQGISWVPPVHSIGPGNMLLFGGKCLTVSSRALPGIAGNSIVTDGPYGFRAFHLGTCGASLAGDSLQLLAYGGARWPPAVPRPRSLIYHLFTCCYRFAWNKGRIVYEKEYKWRVKKKFRIGA